MTVAIRSSVIGFHWRTTDAQQWWGYECLQPATFVMCRMLKWANNLFSQQGLYIDWLCHLKVPWQRNFKAEIFCVPFSHIHRYLKPCITAECSLKHILIWFQSKHKCPNWWQLVTSLSVWCIEWLLRLTGNSPVLRVWSTSMTDKFAGRTTRAIIIHLSCFILGLLSMCFWLLTPVVF